MKGTCGQNIGCLGGQKDKPSLGEGLHAAMDYIARIVGVLQVQHDGRHEVLFEHGVRWIAGDEPGKRWLAIEINDTSVTQDLTETMIGTRFPIYLAYAHRGSIVKRELRKSQVTKTPTCDQERQLGQVLAIRKRRKYLRLEMLIPPWWGHPAKVPQC